MNRSSFFALKAVVSMVFAIALLLAPGPLMSMFGVLLNETGIFVTRLFGVDMMAIGFVCWFGSKSGDKLVSDIALGLFIADAIGSIILFVGQLNGVMNTLGWLNVVLWLFLTLGMGYFRFIQPNTD
jgi:hypothetical protein